MQTAGLIASMRPRQWIKNLLVVAVPLAAGQLLEPWVLGRTVLAFVAMCAASASVYLANDILDREADRKHPEKRNRPLASGLQVCRLDGTCADGGVIAADAQPALLR